jgi:hypothetical protein
MSNSHGSQLWTALLVTAILAFVGYASWHVYGVLSKDDYRPSALVRRATTWCEFGSASAEDLCDSKVRLEEVRLQARFCFGDSPELETWMDRIENYAQHAEPLAIEALLSGYQAAARKTNSDGDSSFTTNQWIAGPVPAEFPQLAADVVPSKHCKAADYLNSVRVTRKAKSPR